MITPLKNTIYISYRQIHEKLEPCDVDISQREIEIFTQLLEE